MNTAAQDVARTLKALGIRHVFALCADQTNSLLDALATEGIQRGHMSLHARQVAIAAGAKGAQVDRLAVQLVQEKTVRIDRAKAILEEWSGTEDE